MPEIDFLSVLHKSTKRDYLARVNEFPKAEAAKVAKKFDAEYWDGDRKFGYGGFKYDGRYRQVAEAMARHYGLKPGDPVTLAAAMAGIVAVGLAASFLPAHRAANIHPMSALREE